MTKHSWIALVFALSLACGGGGAAEEGPEDGTGGETTGGEGTGTAGGTSEEDELRAAVQAMIVAPETPWSEMSHEDKGTDMVMRFEPVFRVMFQGHDAEEFGHFGCPTCHGEDADEHGYEMPAAHLPPVPMPGTDAYREMTEREPHEVEFMEQEVTPAMQTMLGMGATFTCHGCHPTAE